jgi:PPOX class probable F420-dependent enzyme
MVLTCKERQYVERARVARLATADTNGRPNVVPICFALVEGDVVFALDEKPKSGDLSELRRVRDIETNPFVAVVVDRYEEEWEKLGWVQIRGQAEIVGPSTTKHRRAIEELRKKYHPYVDQALERNPVIHIQPGHAVSWGNLDA